MHTAKQRAAARRNIKKALAALKRKKSAHKRKRKLFEFDLGRPNKESRREIRAYQTKRHRHRRSSRKRFTKTMRMPLAEALITALAVSAIFGNPSAGSTTGGGGTTPTAPTISGSYGGFRTDGSQQALLTVSGGTVGGTFTLHISDATDSTNNFTTTIAYNSGSDSFNNFSQGFTPDTFDHTINFFVTDIATGLASNTISILFPAKVATTTGGTITAQRGARYGGTDASPTFVIQVSGQGFTAGTLFSIEAINQVGFRISRGGFLVQPNGAFSVSFAPTGWNIGDRVTLTTSLGGSTTITI